MQRPLGVISDFVAGGGLAEELLRPSDQLVRHVEELLKHFHVLPELGSRSVCELAKLDLTMLEAGLVHSGLVPPKLLTDRVDEISGSELPGLTYEGLVLVNPKGDLRTFTRGDVGRTEAMFYNTHRDIEEHLEDAIRNVRAVLSSEDVEVVARRHLTGVHEDLNPVLRAMRGLGSMPEGHFKAFRKYLNSHPERNIKGPSGAFTARLHILELLVRGETLPIAYGEYLKDNWRYFSQRGRVELDEALRIARGGFTLSGLWKGSGQPVFLKDRIDALRTFFDEFRSIHYGAVARQIPEAIDGKMSGTGGETDPGDFLRSRIVMTRNKGGSR